MIFVDYVFERFGDKILFDKELNPASFNVSSGDVFRVELTDENRIVLVKVDTESK